MQDFSRSPEARFVMAADLYDGYLQRTREFTQGKIETTKRYEDVLARKDIDAVVIATPDHWHRRMTLEALSAGKHVYIEKPMTWSLKEGPEIVAAEKKAGKVLMVGSGNKTSALTAKVRQLIADGALGAVRQVVMVNNRNTKEGAWVYPIPPDASPATIDWPRFLGPAPKKPFSAEVFFRWRCWWEYSGGVATDLFVHQLTTLHEMMNVRAPVSVVANGGLYRWKDGRTVPDLLEAVFNFGEGFTARLCVNLNSTLRVPATTILGEKGSLVLEGEKATLYPEPEDRDIQQYGSIAWPKAMRDDYLRTRGAGQPRPAPPAAQEIKVERGPSHTQFFLDSIRNSTPSRENATEGHAAAGAAHLANRSYREGRRMKWQFESNKVTTG
jgi:predicted dehydrogenase